MDECSDVLSCYKIDSYNVFWDLGLSLLTLMKPNLLEHWQIGRSIRVKTERVFAAASFLLGKHMRSGRSGTLIVAMAAAVTCLVPTMVAP